MARTPKSKHPSAIPINNFPTLAFNSLEFIFSIRLQKATPTIVFKPVNEIYFPRICVQPKEKKGKFV